MYDSFVSCSNKKGYKNPYRTTKVVSNNRGIKKLILFIILLVVLFGNY